MNLPDQNPGLRRPADGGSQPFRMPVQSVDHGIAGTVVSGSIKTSDPVVILPSGKLTKIKRIAGVDGEHNSAQARDAVVITLADNVEVARGDMLAAPQDRPHVADQFVAHLTWMANEPLLPGRSHFISINNCTIPATVTAIKHRVEANTQSKLAARTLSLNELGVCNLSVARPVVFDAYVENRDTGAFLLIDRLSNKTVAAGTIDFALRRADTIPLQAQSVSKRGRRALKHHEPGVLWFTGLPSAGKSTIANLVDVALHARGVHTTFLDGDNVRHGLNRDLGFTEADRVENIRRVGEVAKLMTDAGLIVLCCFISPFRAERRMLRELLGREFIEIFVDTPLATCVARDPKGLYRRALAGEIKNFTGVDQSYEVPQNADLHLSAGSKDPDTLAREVVDELLKRKIIGQ